MCQGIGKGSEWYKRWSTCSSLFEFGLYSLASLWWLVALALVLVFAVRSEYPGLGAYDSFYDSGVYLESARMIRRGYPAYSVVFSTQPPLWLPLLRFSFYSCGE